MRFRQLDMNLLYALSILIEERSVSRAAQRMHVSQPTMSAALARLREYFGDPLLIQQGKSLVPSSLALDFRPMLREIMTNVNVMIAASHGFNPEHSERSFCISTSDYFAVTILPDLFKHVKAVAPQITFEIVTAETGFSRTGDRGEVDVVLLPAEFLIADHPCKFLFHEDYVVMGWKENPLVCKPMSEDDFYNASHLVVAHPSRLRHSISEAFIKSLGREYQVGIVATSFLYTPSLLIGTQSIVMLPRRLAERFAQVHAVRYVDLPFAFKGFEAMLQYHASRAADPSVAWLIEQIEAVVSIRNADDDL